MPETSSHALLSVCSRQFSKRSLVKCIHTDRAPPLFARTIPAGGIDDYFVVPRLAVCNVWTTALQSGPPSSAKKRVESPGSGKLRTQGSTILCFGSCSLQIEAWRAQERVPRCLLLPFSLASVSCQLHLGARLRFSLRLSGRLNELAVRHLHGKPRDLSSGAVQCFRCRRNFDASSVKRGASWRAHRANRPKDALR